MNNLSRLKQQVERQVKRMKKAEDERLTWLVHTLSIGTLGLVFVLPLVAGAYLGQWLDSLVDGYSMRWTLSMIFLGVLVGAMNVYFLLIK